MGRSNDAQNCTSPLNRRQASLAGGLDKVKDA